MIQRDGWWYPDEDVEFHRFHPREWERDIPWFLAMVKGRDRVIQAGGAMGLYPITLAEHFQHIITLEPDPQNWECLEANRQARDGNNRVLPIRGGLSDKPGFCRIEKPEPDNVGANRIAVDVDGGIPVYTIDGLMWPRVGTGMHRQAKKIDAIWLDVEGSELAALKGAERVIKAFSPLIVTEENGNGAKYGVGPNDIEEYLETLEYERVGGMANDRLYRRRV